MVLKLCFPHILQSEKTLLIECVSSIWGTIFQAFNNQKMGSNEILQRIQLNNTRGEELVQFISNELPVLKEAAKLKYFENTLKSLTEKNLYLKSELEYWKQKVIELEVMNNIKQYSTHIGSSQSSVLKPEMETDSKSSKNDSKVVTASPEAEKNISKNDTKKEKQASNTSKSEKKPKEKQVKEEDKEVNVSRLDLRIGRILSAKKHPDAESLYVEDIDVGEEKPRTVVSGLVKFVPLEEMQNRLVVVLCNLKPAKMRGVTSEAMVMCASTPEKVEILNPPVGSLPGNRVICEDFPGDPDTLLPPKKKIFEQVAPDLKTNNERIATYKSSALKVVGKGVIEAATLTNVQIK